MNWNQIEGECGWRHRVFWEQPTLADRLVCKISEKGETLLWI